MTTEELISQFGFPFPNFSQPIKWEDAVGFSTIQSYGDGYSSLYKFGIFNQDKEGNLNLSISVSYGKETGGGISIGTSKKGIWAPLDLNFSDEFSYNDTKKKFLHFGKEISAKEILLYIEEIHKRPTKVVRGFPLRTRLWFWRQVLPALIKFFDLLLIGALYVISGEKIKNDPLGRYFSEKYDERSNQKIRGVIEFEKGNTMDFFGYHAKRWSVVFYCSLHLATYFLFFYQNLHFSLLTNIGRNNFLSICYVVVSFAITEALIPKQIKILISKTPKIFTGIAFKSLKI